MKSFILFLKAALIISIPLNLKAVSFGDVLGQVIDIETNQPVAHAELVFENYYDKVVVTANEHGYYYASHIPEGRYQLRVTYKERTFIMYRVKVYDSYANEVNFFVSANDTLPMVVRETTPDPLIKIFQQNDIVITQGILGQATTSLSDLLMAQPATDIYKGQLYIKGLPVKFFVDGTPVLAPWVFNK